jgi:uncharacterized protein YutD
MELIPGIRTTDALGRYVLRHCPQGCTEFVVRSRRRP